MVATHARELVVRDPYAWLDRETYPFTHREVALSAGRMHYIDEGRGPTLLFVHGTPSWSFEFRHLIRALATRYRCIAPDHLGFGLSERPPGFAYTPESHATVLAQFVARLGLRDVTLVVHDYGGPIGLPLALASSSIVKRLVVINSWMWPFDDDRVVRRWGRFAGSWFGKLLYRELALPLRTLMPRTFADRSKLTPAIHAHYVAPFASRRSRAQVLWPLARALLASGPFYASLEARADALANVPTSIIWGVKDPALGKRQLDHWRRLLPHAPVTKIDAGHWPHEERPSEVVDALLRALDQPSDHVAA
jgi:pimeloyl-ACP methyl ester carboxylesterase